MFASFRSRRERVDFYRTILIYGVPLDPTTGEPNFEFVREKAKLYSKSIDQISRYYTEFLTACKIIKTAHQNDEKAKKEAKLKAPEESMANTNDTASSTAAEKSSKPEKNPSESAPPLIIIDDTSPSPPQPTTQPTTTTTTTNSVPAQPTTDSSLTVTNRTATISSPPLTGPLTEAAEKEKEFLLSYSQAKRVIDRVTMFLTLRKKVLKIPEEELLNRFRYLSLKNSKLPSWWVAGVHDIGLFSLIHLFTLSLF
jgi:hypothetical protein